MATYIAFLRAVNVGGRTVPMAELRACVEDGGFADAATHIQSGNLRVVSRLRSAAKVEARLEQIMSAAFGFDVPAVVRSPAELRSLAESDPESPLGAESRHYVAFLRATPTASQARALTGWDVDGERMSLAGRDLHLWLTKPSHQAKATNARIEKLAGTTATSRSWSVVTALAKKWG